MTLQEFKLQVPYTSIAKPTRIIGNPTPMHLLYNAETSRVIAFSAWVPTINTLDEICINTVPKYSQNFPATTVLPEAASMKEPFKIIWSFESNRWVISDKDFTFEEMYTNALLIEKAAALDEINYRTVHYRRPVFNSVAVQESIYLMKYQEALEIKNTLGDITEPWNYPFVHDYADLTGIDIRQAAEEIIIQHGIYRTRLSNTETLRIKYTRQIKECKEIENIYKIMNSFYSDGEVYGKL